MEIFVAIWAKPTRSTDPYELRVANLAAAIRVASDRFTAAKLDGRGPIRAIFVAPEYLMSAPRANFVDAKALTEDARDEIVGRLRSMSEGLTGMLFVPGTVAFSKSVDRPESQKRKRDPRTGERTGPAKAESREAKALRAFDNPWGAVDYAMDMGIPGVPNATMQHVAQRKGAFQTDLTNFRVFGAGPLVSAPEPRIFKNNIYVFLDGTIVHKYSKQADFYETLGDANVHFIPGGHSGVKDIGGIRFGFEICMDHAIGILGAAQAAHRARGLAALAERPDIQIIVSDYASNNTNNMVMRNGGFALHASTQANNSGVFHRAANGAIPIGGDIPGAFERLGAQADVGGGPLRFWKIVL